MSEQKQRTIEDLPRPPRDRSLSGQLDAGGRVRSALRRPRYLARRQATRVAVALVALLAAGCATLGGGSDSSSPAACDTPGFSDNEIRLGFVYPDSGGVSGALLTAMSGFIARIGEANAAGGIHGRKLVYTWRDDAGDKAQNLQSVRDLVERQHVFGLVEASVSASGGADYLREQNIPVTGMTAEAFWADRAYRNMFSYAYVFTTGSSVSTFGEYVKAQGGTRAALIQSDVSSAPNDIGSRMSVSLAAEGIQTAPGHFIYNPNITDPVQLGQQLSAAHVDVVIAVQGGADLAEVMRGIRQAGAPVKVFLAPSGYDRSLLAQYGQTISGLTAAVNYVPFDIGGPAHQKYLRAMAEYAPELQPPDQELAFVTYIFTDLFLYGLDKAGDCPTRAQFVDTLRASTYDARGLLPGPVDMTNDFGQISTCYTFMRVNAGGTAYDAVPDPKADPAHSNRWCGHRLDK